MVGRRSVKMRRRQRRLAAKPFADAQLEAHSDTAPGAGPPGCARSLANAPCWGGAQRTECAGSRRLHAQGDLRRGVVDVTCLKAQERGIR